jgi:osmoprotectant transport system permease protein
MRRIAAIAMALLLLLGASAAHASTTPHVTLGSKAFPESWILGEAMAELARPAATVDHRRNLGGTEVLWNALSSGSVDAYVEYTGTIAEVILKSETRLDLAVIRARLDPLGIGVSEPLGFNDGYAIAVTRAVSLRFGLHAITDLARHPEVRAAFTHEFLGRKDGYPGLAARYGLGFREVRGIQHELAYEALASGQADATDIYTTDPEIARLGLVLLDDDLGFFTRYDAVVLYRADLPPRAPAAFAAMMRLVGAIDESRMLRANALVAGGAESPERAAALLLRDALGQGSAAPARARSAFDAIASATLRHLELVFVALFAATCAGVPLGILAARSRALATLTLTTTGLLQTIPSLALLALLIPILGIGAAPALVALFLYSLLPIVRNTYTGLTGIAPALSEAAEAIGLSPRARLFYVSLPLASPTIMAGIKTSAVITVGTATLAALVGAGGLGDAILEGIALRDTPRILEGAVPAALLALLVQWAFGWLDRFVVPRGLRLIS